MDQPTTCTVCGCGLIRRVEWADATKDQRAAWRAQNINRHDGRGLCAGCYQKAWHTGGIPHRQGGTTVARAINPTLTMGFQWAPWMDDSLCSETDPDLFHPTSGAGYPIKVRAAKAICARCPVREQCLSFALEHGEPWGIWGGLTEDERDQLRGAA